MSEADTHTDQSTGPAKRSGRKWLYRSLWVVLAALLVAVVDYMHWDLVRHRLVVTADGVYQSAEFPPDELVVKAKELQLKTVVDLRDLYPERVEAERKALTEAGIRHAHIPMRQQPTPESVLEFLELSGDPANRPLLIHCEHGVARSILMAAAYRMVHLGWDNDRAWRGTGRLPDSLRFVNKVIPRLLAVRPGTFKGDWVLEFDLEDIEAAAAAKSAEGDTEPRDR